MSITAGRHVGSYLVFMSHTARKGIFIITLLCGVSKGFMKVLQAFIKPFEASQKSVKIKIQLNFYLPRFGLLLRLSATK